MKRRLLALLACAAWLAVAAVPTPKQHFGYEPGEDYKLAGYTEILGYFRALERASDRIRLTEFGRSSEGRPMVVAFISAAANLRNLERYREISRRLALGQATEEEARGLAAEGKVIVWIDSGMHATEVAPAQHAPHLAYRLVTGETAEIQRIRDRVILIQAPVLNPDGLEMVVAWYRRNLGTPHETARLPFLYQKYAGHDNNRDYYMFHLPETQHVGRMLFREWFPQIVYNQHQAPPFPARIFVPPYAEPLNPNIPAAVVEGIHLIGAAMKERFAREGKSGVLSYAQFDAWWNGGLRTAATFHNMHGILTETAGSSYATPRVYDPKDFPARFAGGLSAREPSVFYPRPWLGGRWALKDAVEYMLTADFAILDFAASRSEQFLLKAWQMARDAVQAGRKGSPFAYVVPPEQWDRSSAVEMLRRLQMGGLEVWRARSPFVAEGKPFPAGSYVLPAAQAFRAYLLDLLEPQKYPDLRTDSGAPRRPYDITGWTLSLQMGVRVERIEKPFEAELELAGEIAAPAPSLDPRENSSFLVVADLLDRGVRVRRASDGRFLVEGRDGVEAFATAAYELRRPRVALYQPWIASSDTGWTQWLLDSYKIPYQLVYNEDLRKGGLRSRFDSLLLASLSAEAILNGNRYGEPATPRNRPYEYDPKSVQRPEYTGGIGPSGLAELERFVREGGTLIALDDATELPVRFFPLPVHNVVRTTAMSEPAEARTPAPSFYCPGSLLRATVDTAHPLAFGMPEQTVVFSTGGHAFEIALLEEFRRGEHAVRSVVRYADKDLLASGWVTGERAVLGKPILLEVSHGQGRVVLFGFRPQFRGQTFGTFKLLLNAIYLASARKVGS
ncbi:MAG: M14 family metallopeptidase [Bryobacterales bacterium]|nr:M14 family metallopeptidase [Bryobacterales bacterium]